MDDKVSLFRSDIAIETSVIIWPGGTVSNTRTGGKLSGNRSTVSGCPNITPGVDKKVLRSPSPLKSKNVVFIGAVNGSNPTTSIPVPLKVPRTSGETNHPALRSITKSLILSGSSFRVMCENWVCPNVAAARS